MKAKKFLAAIMAIAMIASMMSVGVYAADEATVDVYAIGAEQTYETFSAAVEAAADTNGDGAITYEIYGKVEIAKNGWVNPSGKSGATTVNFVGKTDDAEISLTHDSSDNWVQIIGTDGIEMEAINYTDLTLSKPNGIWVGDAAHANRMFTTWMRGASTSATVTYTNCVFPNGASNNQYGKTVYDGCEMYNEDYYALWIYDAGDNLRADETPASVEVKNCEMVADRGVKIYSENQNGTAYVNTTIENCTFDIESKPAIVSSVDGTITMTDVTYDDCEYGLLEMGYLNGNPKYDLAKATIDGEIPQYVASVTSTNQWGATSTVYVTEKQYADLIVETEGNGTIEEPAVIVSNETNSAICDSLQEALEEAENGATIILLADAEITEATAFNNDVTIDLGGNTISMTAEPAHNFGSELRSTSYYINADVTFKNGTVEVTNSEEYAKHGSFFVEVGDALTFDNVALSSDGFNSFAFIQTYGETSYVNGTTVDVTNDGDGNFMYSEELLADVTINDTEITLDNLGGGIASSGINVNVDNSTITMTNLDGVGLGNAIGTINNTTLTVDGAEYAVTNEGVQGTLTLTDSTITAKNIENENGNVGIYVADEEKLSADENSAINSSMYIPDADGGEPTIYYVLTFAEDEFAPVRELNGEEIDLADYVPTLDGYTFAGWYSDADLTEAIETVVLDADKTVYAAWTKNRTSSGNGGLQAGGDTSRTGADDLTQDTKEDETDADTTTPVVDTQTPAETSTFVDVTANDWFSDAVKYVYENGLMNGTAADKFSPNGAVTRAMLVTVLYRAEGSPATNKSIPFGDVDMGAYYADAVVWAKQNGIVNGKTENEFAPNASITREQIAAIIYRYASFKGYDMSAYAELTGFADAKSISSYAEEAMKYAVGAGVINGKTATTVNPQDNATRAEIAAILMRFIEANK